MPIKAKEMRIARKMYEKHSKIINKTQTLLTLDIKQTADKWKKHVPMHNDETIENMAFDDNAIAIKFKDSINCKYYGCDKTWKKGDHSFSLSTLDQRGHAEYITQQLTCIKNKIKLIFNGNITNSMNISTAETYDCIKDITDEFNKNEGTNFKQVFAINIFPPHSFVFNSKNKNIKIATYYIVGHDGVNNKIHIFYDFKKIFGGMDSNGCRRLSRQINEYNANDDPHNIKDIFIICDNLAPICSLGHYAIGNCIYEITLDKINEPKKNKFIKIVNDNTELIKELFSLDK